MSKPHSFPALSAYHRQKYDSELVPEKTIMVGDRLATDMIFGNLNKMPTVYVNPF